MAVVDADARFGLGPPRRLQLPQENSRFTGEDFLAPLCNGNGRMWNSTTFNRPNHNEKNEVQRCADSTSVPPLAEYLRLPPPVQRCPLTGLSRSTLNELILPCEGNGYRPPVRSILLKKRHATRGIRLIHRESLLDYLNSLQVAHANVLGNGLRAKM